VEELRLGVEFEGVLEELKRRVWWEEKRSSKMARDAKKVVESMEICMEMMEKHKDELNEKERREINQVLNQVGILSEKLQRIKERWMDFHNKENKKEGWGHKAKIIK
jgi:predicted deacylase